MLISQETYDKLNGLVGHYFAMNAFSDNIAYNLGAYDFKNIEAIYHEQMAHWYTKEVDEVTDMMLSLDARPVRKPIPGFEKDYGGNLVDIFDDNLKAVNEFRDDILATLEMAELNGDVEAKLALEDFLEDFIPYRKQSEIWARYAHMYEGNEKSFEQRFGQITRLIGQADDD